MNKKIGFGEIEVGDCFYNQGDVIVITDVRTEGYGYDFINGLGNFHHFGDEDQVHDKEHFHRLPLCRITPNELLDILATKSDKLLEKQRQEFQEMQNNALRVLESSIRTNNL